MLAFCFLSSGLAVVLFVAAAFLIAFLLLPYLGLFTTLLFLLILEIFAIGVVRRLSMKEFSKIGILLFDQCDPSSYIKANERLLHRLFSRSRFLPAVKSNLAVGYYSQGEAEKGVEICRMLAEENPDIRNVSFTPVLYMNLCTMLLSMGRIAEAREAFDKAYAFVVKIPDAAPIGRRYRKQMNLLALRQRIMSGNLEGGKEELLKAFSEVRSPYEKINIQQLLSIVYREEGALDKYKESLRYMAENGNQLYAALEAGKELERLEESASV